jgi:hypothetical protein
MVFGLPREAVPELFRVFEAFGQVRCVYKSMEHVVFCMVLRGIGILFPTVAVRQCTLNRV